MTPEEIFDYKERRQNGLFEVKLLKMPVFDQTTGEEIGENEAWHVCSKLRGIVSYACFDEETAIELCEELNILTRAFAFDKELPEQLQLIDDSEVYELGKIINDKHLKLEQLATAIEHELSCELTYIHCSNSVRLYPEKVQEALGLTKAPTEKQMQAYIEEKHAFEFDMWKIAKGNTSLIRQQLDYINDRISFEKYSLRTRWIK